MNFVELVLSLYRIKRAVGLNHTDACKEVAKELSASISFGKTSLKFSNIYVSNLVHTFGK